MDPGLYLYLSTVMRNLLVVCLFILPAQALACPYCHESIGKNKSLSTFAILGVFVLLTYIPFYLLFRAAKKYDPKNIGN